MKLSIDDRRLSISPLASNILEKSKFQLGIYSIGYEERSRFVVDLLSQRTRTRVGIDLGGRGIGSYEKSKSDAVDRGDRQPGRDSIELLGESLWLDEIEEGADVFIDVSSMDRRTMSWVIYHVLRNVGDSSLSVHFLYAPAQFSAPPETQLPLESSSPVNSLLASYPREPKTPTVLVVGVGYEVGLALGVVETFEPARVVAYVPRGSDKRFDAEVDRVNAPLFMDQGYVTRSDYYVSSPAAAFIDLKDRVFSLRAEARVVLVPLGPKIFSSMCLVLGYLCSPDVAVWRLSTQLDPRNADRKPDGKIVGYTLHIHAAKPVSVDR